MGAPCGQMARLLAALVALYGINAVATHDDRPNFVIIVVDDLGYGDLGCYGNDSIASPNIDALANEGVRMTQLYSAAPICTPSRAGFLTGRYPVRLGMTNENNRFRTLNSPAQPGGIPESEITFAEVAQQQGYRTAMVGKWHLGIGAHGEHLPTRQGFESFFGMPVTNVQTCPVCESDLDVAHGDPPREPGCKGGKRIHDTVGGHGQIVPRRYIAFMWSLTGQVWTGVLLGWAGLALFVSRRTSLTLLVLVLAVMGLVLWYSATFTLLHPASCILMRDGEVVEQPMLLQNLTQRNTREAVAFIRSAQAQREAGDGRPWMLYLAYVKVHTALFSSPEFVGRSRHGAYGDNIEELDWSVGEVTRALRELGVEQDTFVYFTSDNGPFQERGVEGGSCGRAPDASGRLQGPLRGAKGQTWECGVRVPGIVRWPRLVPGGRVHTAVASLLDLFPTLLRLVGAPSAAADRTVDGVDMLPWLLHEEPPVAGEEGRAEDGAVAAERPFLFHYCGSTVTAVRHGRYKAHYFTPVWDEGLTACPTRALCPCRGTQHDPPLLFDVLADPTESAPLDTAVHRAVLSAMARAKEEHQRGVEPVPNQLSTPGLPWLFPCCNPGGRRSAFEQAWRIATGTCTCRE